MIKKVSIVIPVFNTAEFLNDCLTSVVNQTYDHIEIIIIDNSSTDQSRVVINKFSGLDKRIKTFFLNEIKGVGAARNYGLERVTGEFIYFLDSDDYLADNTIEILVENIGDSPVLSGKLKRIRTKEDSVIIEQSPELKENQRIKRQFKNMSVLNRLFSTEFVKQHQLRFSEEVNCYSDLSFIVPIIINASHFSYVTDCFYFKRLRNDSITNPSLLQMDSKMVISDFLQIFSKLRDEYQEYDTAASYLDNRFLNIYRSRIVMFFVDSLNIDAIFDELAVATVKVDAKNLKKQNVVIKKEIKLLIKRKQSTYIKVMKAHHLARNVKRSIGSKRKIYVQLYRMFFIKRPLKERTVVFESFLGKNYSDSPKYIYEYMINNNMNYNYVWIFNKTGKDIPGVSRQVKRFSLAYYYYLGTSKYWVSNSRMPLHLDKRPDNVYLQTWHGTPLKKLVYDMNDVYSANPNYKQNFYQQARHWDYLISPNQYSSEIFKRAFKYDKKMLEFGYPRNDVLYQKNNPDYINSLKESLNIPLDKKVILYAPTWRDDEFYESGKYKFNLKLDLHKMREILGEEYVIVLRMHYFIANEIDTNGFEDFVYNLSKYDDIAELYLLSDILITDYSSVFFDYANLKRPILFYTYDLEKYRDTLRGFYIDIEKEVPGPLLKNSEEIIEAIIEIEKVKSKYKDIYHSFYIKYCDWDDGEASKKVVNEIFPK